MEGYAFFKSLSRRWHHAGRLPRGPRKGGFLNLTILKLNGSDIVNYKMWRFESLSYFILV